MLISCSKCSVSKDVLPVTINRNKKRNGGNFVCHSCKIKDGPTRPQNTKEFWADPDLRAKMSEVMKNSEAHRQSREIISEQMMGEGNHRFGTIASEETRKKMSESRTGKFGENATAWKGGKSSLLSVVKTGIYRRYAWHRGIYDRDGWKCVKCQSTKQLDAHHTVPFATLLTGLLHGTEGMEYVDKVEYLITHPVLKDAEGETLCRACHREVHANWGSHTPHVI